MVWYAIERSNIGGKTDQELKQFILSKVPAINVLKIVSQCLILGSMLGGMEIQICALSKKGRKVSVSRHSNWMNVVDNR